MHQPGKDEKTTEVSAGEGVGRVDGLKIIDVHELDDGVESLYRELDAVQFEGIPDWVNRRGNGA